MTNQNLLALACVIPGLLIQSCIPNTSSRVALEAPDETPVQPASMPIEVADGAISFEATTSHSMHFPGSSDDVFLVLTTRTGQLDATNERSPLNIALVIDKSGSMEAEGKLDYVKKACETVIQNLSSRDQVGLVSYDSYVDIVAKSAPVTDKDKLIRRIQQQRSGGSTNLSGGMLEGYAQTLSTLDDEQVNRVLLLSDGLANQGITDPEELNKIAQGKFEELGIGLSSFGVGLNFNEDLMTSLAESGMGNYHFIESADMIPEIFAEELNGLLSVVAQNTRLEVTFPESDLQFKEAYGYGAEIDGDRITVQFNDLFAEEEKTVVLRFSKQNSQVNNDFDFACSLAYDDVQNNYQRAALKNDVRVAVTSDLTAYKNSRNPDAYRECILFQSNATMEVAMKLVDQMEYDKARAVADEGIQTLQKEISTYGSNPDLQKQLDNFTTYRKELETIEARTEQERKYFQKSNKSSNYKLRKKKS